MHNKFLQYRLRRLRLADTGGDEGSGSEQSHDAGALNEHKDDQSKDFSRALAKRAAEIEAKYSDYEELKAKAAKYDAQESESKSDLDRLGERLAAIEKERDELKAADAHRTLVTKIAADTGLPTDMVALLSGDDENTLAEQAKKLSSLMEKTTTRQRGPKAASQNGKRPPEDAKSAMDMLRAAYAD
ncbi:capsid assembly scaffolding protein Gp46 family protein [Bifidobacterium vansinderenii]|uniref:Uncharacterized protein n=1 Tax=Bifidobacterium vansinderenii TaxID=1984871 RepID=A0A229W1T5_9BIFI|nr:DUF4355 domain-containing protein [Bifidobacterium vansinderenii]OXN01650.1 hypothetical protein Tam10B_0092 [Bifidobacterium vansinderenii]